MAILGYLYIRCTVYCISHLEGETSFICQHYLWNQGYMHRSSGWHFRSKWLHSRKHSAYIDRPRGKHRSNRSNQTDTGSWTAWQLGRAHHWNKWRRFCMGWSRMRHSCHRIPLWTLGNTDRWNMPEIWYKKFQQEPRQCISCWAITSSVAQAVSVLLPTRSQASVAVWIIVGQEGLNRTMLFSLANSYGSSDYELLWFIVYHIFCKYLDSHQLYCWHSALFRDTCKFPLVAGISPPEPLHSTAAQTHI